jgi:hypothetical protein
MFRIARAAVVALVACCGIAFAAPADDWAGVYSHRFKEALVDGTKYTAKDVVEIAPIGQGEAYVSASLQFYNGHSCSIWVVMKEVGEGLEYRAGDTSDYPHGCVLRVTRKDGQIVFSDANNLCRTYACGARGILDGAKLPIASKKKIKYLKKLQATDEYKNALKEAGR